MPLHSSEDRECLALETSWADLSHFADEPERLTFATQGGEFSYHALAARTAAPGFEVEIQPHREFGQVNKASRQTYPGLGVIAISTVAGTVDDSAKEIVRKRPAALARVVARVDLPIQLALIGSQDQTLEELDHKGARVLCQKPALAQCTDFLDEHFKWLKRDSRWESTRAIERVVQLGDRDHVAIGPSFAAEPLGGAIVGPEQINPEGSITSFYVLQRNPRESILPQDTEKTEVRSVVSLAHPEGEGEIDKFREITVNLGIRIARFIPFAIGGFTRYSAAIRRGGGIFEVKHDEFDEELTEWCARVNGLVANDGQHGPFNTEKLGTYNWYHEDDLDVTTLEV